MLKIWTDGSCLGNPGPGGWGFIATNGTQVAERCGGEKNTTNNKMELTAVIKALTATRKHNEVEIHTDSQYVKNGMESWIKNWKRNNWKTADKKTCEKCRTLATIGGIGIKHKNSLGLGQRTCRRRI